jgi:hypothetical protein
LSPTFVYVTLTLNNNQVFARRPNGTYKSPSGVCEQIVSHAGLPRCSNGTHRSTVGNCEQVLSSLPESGISQGSPNVGQNNNSGQSSSDSSSSPSSLHQLQALNDQSVWNHVYNPSRLQVVDDSRIISGVIERIRREIRPKLDPQFSDLINSANVNGQHGNLVLEPICINPITQFDTMHLIRTFIRI